MCDTYKVALCIACSCIISRAACNMKHIIVGMHSTLHTSYPLKMTHPIFHWFLVGGRMHRKWSRFSIPKMMAFIYSVPKIRLNDCLSLTISNCPRPHLNLGIWLFRHSVKCDLPAHRPNNVIATSATPGGFLDNNIHNKNIFFNLFYGCKTAKTDVAH